MSGLPETCPVLESASIISESTDKVFDIELLREKILDYVIHEKEKVVVSNAACCRLVNKAWLDSVSRILLLCQQPLVHLSLNQKDYCNSTGSRKDKLDKFMSDVIGTLPKSERIPPLAISALYHLRAANVERFDNCLINCGMSLTELNITFLRDAVPIFFDSSKILFPNLRSFSVCFQSQSIYNDPWTLNADEKIDLIQCVFDASNKLKSVCIGGDIFDGDETSTFVNLVFPTSVTSLKFFPPVNDSMLEALVTTCSLPNLKELDLCVDSAPLIGDLISGILENFRKTLQRFCILSYGYEEYTKFSLPLMEKLESLHIYWGYLPKENCSSVQQFVPKLNHLSLIEQKPSMLHRWIERSCLETVTSLELSLTTDVDDDPVELSWAHMQALKVAFPNIRKLDITLSGTETELHALKFLFTEMEHLQHLRLVVELDDVYACPGTVVSPARWDSIFTGIPDELIGGLKLSPELWNGMQLRCNPSIRGMTDLHTLELEGIDGENRSLISAATFNFAFFKMPKLKKLILKGDFFTTKAMEEKWKEEDGRTIENYIPDPTSPYSTDWIRDWR